MSAKPLFDNQHLRSPRGSADLLSNLPKLAQQATVENPVSMKLRVFTESIFRNIPSLRFPLKVSALTLPYSCYNLPFYFDHARLLSYRVQAFARDFFLNKEQRKYYITYDLGIKKHLPLSSNPFVHFKRLGSFGNLIYGKASMLHWFSSLNHAQVLHLPYSKFTAGIFIKNSLDFKGYGWHVDRLPEIFKKRLIFNRKLTVQNNDLDLTISSSQSSWAKAFSQYPSPSTLGLLMPTRYNSFIISSYTQPRRLAFPYRFFRYFHKYFLRKSYWSSLMVDFWGQHLPCGPVIFNSATLLNCSFLIAKKLNFFFDLNLIFILFAASSKNFRQLINNSFSRFFWSSMFHIGNSLVSLLTNILLAFNKNLVTNLLATNHNSRVVYVNDYRVSSRDNNLFGLRFRGKKYVVVDLGQRLNVFCHHGYYRPWVRRFVFSLNGTGFLKVFPKPNLLTKRNAIGHPRFSKDIHRYNWGIFNPFGKLQRIIFKWWRKLLLVFLRNLSTRLYFFNRLPVFLGRFFKFARRLFPAAKSYGKMLFDSKYAHQFCSRGPCKKQNLNISLGVFNSLSRRLALKTLRLRVKAKNNLLSSKRRSRRYKFMLLQKAYSRLQRFFWFFPVAVSIFIKNTLPLKYPFISNWRVAYPLLISENLFNNNFPWIKWASANNFSTSQLGMFLFKGFHKFNLGAYFLPVFFTKQLVNQFLNDLEWKFLFFKRKVTPYAIYTTLRLFFEALNLPSLPIAQWWKVLTTNFRFSSYLYQHFNSRLDLYGVLNKAQHGWNKFWIVLGLAYKLKRVFSFENSIVHDFNFLPIPIVHSTASCVGQWSHLLLKPCLIRQFKLSVRGFFPLQLKTFYYNYYRITFMRDKLLFSFIQQNRTLIKYLFKAMVNIHKQGKASIKFAAPYGTKQLKRHSPRFSQPPLSNFSNKRQRFDKHEAKVKSYNSHLTENKRF